MRSRTTRRLRTQTGGALIIMVLIIFLAGTTALFAVLDSSGIKVDRDKKTVSALSTAKSAVIAWAVKADTPGQLPCPEDTSLIGTINEGVAKSSCTLPAIGRLPWKSLGVGDLRDGNNEKLWYAISAGFRASPINSDTPAQLTVDGAPNFAVAILFSAGTAIEGQVRSIPTSAIPPNVTDYLDGTNNDGDNIFLTKLNSSNVNDVLLSVTQKELMHTVERRILREAKGCLDTYAQSHAGRYVWASPSQDVLNHIAKTNNVYGRIPTEPYVPPNEVINLSSALNSLQLSFDAYKVALNDSGLKNTLESVADNAKDVAETLKDANISSAFNNVADSGKDAAEKAKDFADHSGFGSPSLNTVQTKINTAVSSIQTAVSDTAPSSERWSNVSGCVFFPLTYWNDWRDLIFYKVATGFAPDQATPSCGTSCLSIDTNNTYRAMLVASGKGINSQDRTNQQQKQDVANYLEGSNSLAISSSSKNFESFQILNSEYSNNNDQLQCLDGKVGCL